MFVLRRNLPLAWGGWYDSFQRAVGPAGRPWVHVGDGTPADINNLEELHIPSNYATINGGGPSYEYQPFTPNWGVEMEMWFPVEGLAVQGFATFFTDSWAKVAPGKFENVAGVRLMHAPALGEDFLQFGEFQNTFSSIERERRWVSPIAGYQGKTLFLRIWVENDRWMRIWLNNNYVWSAMISQARRLGPTRRCLRFLNTGLCDCWVRWINHYDRPSSVPNKSVWISSFYDDFERAGPAVGNGWTPIGTRGEILSGSWGRTTDGTDAGAAILRNAGNGSGRFRIEATYGGYHPGHPDRKSGLVLNANPEGTQGLIATIEPDSVGIQDFTGTSLSSNLPAFSMSNDATAAIVAGDKIAFCTYNGITWIEHNGNPICYTGSIPYTGTHAGLYVERKDWNVSASWQDVRFYNGLG